eukprot:GHVN01038869.1.p1 GENE.GHVN01038869.1~~GHVN01038869.1.p1  ORF type:complete len:168 (-),score=28.74 GHVN01038869.1:89-592(-)
MFIEAYVVPITALLLLALSLSGHRPLQRVAFRVGQAELGVGSLNLSLGWLVLIYSIVRLSLLIRDINKLQDLGDPDHTLTRKERNFWICVFGMLLWIILMRWSKVATNLWNKIDLETKELERLEKEEEAPTAPPLHDSHKSSAPPPPLIQERHSSQEGVEMTSRGRR